MPESQYEFPGAHERGNIGKTIRLNGRCPKKKIDKQLAGYANKFPFEFRKGVIDSNAAAHRITDPESLGKDLQFNLLLHIHRLGIFLNSFMIRNPGPGIWH